MPHSITLASCKRLQTWFSTRFAARFSTSSCGFATRFRPAFDFFVENLVANCSRFAGSCACYRQMEYRKKNRFKQVRRWLSTCLRPGLLLARIMECGLNYRFITACVRLNAAVLSLGVTLRLLRRCFPPSTNSAAYTSNKCHNLRDRAMRCRVDNSWPVERWHHAVKP